MLSGALALLSAGLFLGGIVAFRAEPPIEPALVFFSGAGAAGLVGGAVGLRKRMAIAVASGVFGLLGFLALLFTVGLMDAR